MVVEVVCGDLVSLTNEMIVLPYLFYFSSLGHEYEFLLQQKLDEAGLAYLGKDILLR